MGTRNETEGGIEVGLAWDELMGLDIPRGLPSSPSTAICCLPDRFDVRQGMAAAVAQAEGLDLGDYGHPSCRLDGGKVVVLFPVRA